MKTIEISAEIEASKCLVVVGSGVINQLEEIISKVKKSPERVAVVIGEGVVGEGIADEMRIELKSKHKIFVLKEGEDSKSLSSIEKLCGDFSDFGLTRDDLIVAVGGGLTCDVVGFAAAVYHRGTPVIYVPTTLLAQVDAAIGGKTGVNLEQGKNLVGAFAQPLAVLCDTKILDTLPEREYLSGMGEIAKYCFLVENLNGLKDYFSKIGLENLDPQKIREMSLDDKIATCIGVKLFVVSQDEKESGLRSLLNYGHTLAHALEIAGRFDLRHGEAVAIGLIYAAELAHILGRIDEARVKYHYEVLEFFNLKTKLEAKFESAELVALMKRDKKSRAEVRFVLEEKNGIEHGVVVKEKDIVMALEAIALEKVQKI